MARLIILLFVVLFAVSSNCISAETQPSEKPIDREALARKIWKALKEQHSCTAIMSFESKAGATYSVDDPTHPKMTAITQIVPFDIQKGSYIAISGQFETVVNIEGKSAKLGSVDTTITYTEFARECLLNQGDLVPPANTTPQKSYFVALGIGEANSVTKYRFIGPVAKEDLPGLEETIKAALPVAQSLARSISITPEQKQWGPAFKNVIEAKP